ncbi:MAG: phosphatase PAP2 family protein [Catenulispora sp.]|nr:phosphatase PAP2 family protein [Catenulispora sp.]
MTASAAGPLPQHTRVRARTQIALRLLLGLAVIFAVEATIGWLVTGHLAHIWPLSAEDGVDRTLAQHRGHTLDNVSGFFSTLANTPSAIALSLVAFVAIRLLTHRWPEALFVATALLSEVGIFLLTTVVIERSRPAVPHLDPHAPPTSSFPSGHVAAAVALYAAVVLVLRRHRAPWPAWLLLAVPCAVGFARLYRGMHHPSDVLAGALLGALCVLLAYRVVLTGRDRR